MSSDDFEGMLMQQASKAINITLGAIIHYINSDTFSDLSEEQRDYVFEYVIDTWSILLPYPVDGMWMKQVMLLALTQQLEAVRVEKSKTEDDHVSRMRMVYKQLGWDYDTKRRNKND